MKKRQGVPREPFSLRIIVNSPNGGGRSIVKAKVFVRGQLFCSNECSAPPRDELLRWVDQDSELLSSMLNDEVNRGTTSPVCVRAKRELRLVGETRFDQFFARPKGGNWNEGNPIKALLRSPWLRQIIVDSTGDIHGLVFEIFHLGTDGRPDAAPGTATGAGIPYDGFIGLRAPIIYVPDGDADGRAPQRETSVGVLACRLLGTVETGEATRELNRLRDAGRLSEVKLHTPLLDRLQKVMTPADRGALYWLLADVHRGVWHFASHIRRPGGVSIFELDNEASIRAMDFGEPDCPPFVGQPLVFLNLCKASVDLATPERTLPDLLAEKGAFGVIAPNLLVDESFATKFGNLFYAALFGAEERKTVGWALVDARRAAWGQGYSGGLGYMLHAQEDFEVVDLSPDAPIEQAAA
jgi:hypothetical protein